MEGGGPQVWLKSPKSAAQAALADPGDFGTVLLAMNPFISYCKITHLELPWHMLFSGI